MQQLVILLILLAFHGSTGQVCTQSYVTYEAFYSLTVEYYHQVYYTGCGLFGWSRCDRIRTSSRNVIVSMRHSMLQYRLVCCSGYSGSPPNCQPICSRDCANGGTCNAPDACTCSAGWTGQYCTDDIDECTSGVACEQMCTNTQGSFQCSCSSGYTVDGNMCNDINECNNDPRPCVEVCNNNDGSYTCSCTDNSRTVTADGNCTDVDECATPGRCQHICNNRVGGFFCTCNEGYQLVNGSNCTDIDECAISPNPCDQMCTNNEGSFVCSCNNGYVLDDDQRSCNDVNECMDNNGSCEHICTNTDGSFACSCQPGYDLGSDGLVCIAQQCRPTLLAPQNGNIICDGVQVTLTTCNFSCDPGYSLVGSMERTCQPNNSWSGSNTSCDIMSCEVLQSPSNGFVVLPCNREFQSVCNITCEGGYYTEGPYTQSCEVSDNGMVEWSTAPLCREITPCGPDPCQHNGECVIVGDNDFSCDCSLTGYTGVTCNKGVLTLPSYPALTIGVPLTLSVAAVPDNELIVNIASSDTDIILISPPTVTITNTTLSAIFTIEASGGGEMGGLYSISYRLSGVNADDYVIPSDSVVFVRPMHENQSYFEVRGLPNGKLEAAGCFMAPRSLDCQNGDQQINIYSTSQWSYDNNTLRTNGIVYLVDGDSSLPLAIAGANITVEQNSLTVERLNINFSITSEGTESCTSFVPSVSDLDDFLRFKALVTTFVSSTLRLLPTWMQFMVTSNEEIDSSGDTAYLAYVVTREELNNIDVCQNIITNENTVHLVVRHDSNLIVNVSGSQVTHVPTDNSVVCFSVELCSQTESSLFHIGLPTNIERLNQLSFMNDLASAGWRMDLNAVTFAASGNLVPVNMMETYWTGSSYQSVSFLGAHIGLGGSFTREFSDATTVVYICVLGDVYWRVENLNQIFDDPLNQRWTGAASGSVTIAVTVPFHGSTVNINFTASLAHISIGGLGRPVCLGSADPAGIFATTNTTTFITFGDFFPSSGTNCQLNPYVYMNGNNLTLVGFQSNCNDLQLGRLKFTGLSHHFVIVAGLESSCNYDEFPTITNPSVLVESFVNNRNAVYQLNDFISIPNADGSIMRTSFAQGSDGFSVITKLTEISLLGDSLVTSLRIDNTLLSFSGNISLYNMYPSTIQATASVDQSFDSLSINLTGVVGSELVTAFQNSINEYLKVLVQSAGDRIMVSTTGSQRANNQLNASRTDVNYQNEMLTIATMEYQQAIQQLEVTNQTYIDALQNVNDEILSMFNSVCEFNSCSVCPTGLQCENCQIPIEGVSQNLEQNTCFIQITQRIPPFQKSNYCWSEITSMQETVFGNCFRYSCNLHTEYIAFQELVREECLAPSYLYETRDEGYSCTVAVNEDQYVYNVSQLCCSPSQCSTMSSEKECVQSNVACRLIRKQLSSTTSDQVRVSLDALDVATKQLSEAEIVVEEKRLLRDLQMKAYEQSFSTLAVVNASIAALNESQVILQDEVLAGILPLYNQVQGNNGNTENIIAIENITFSTITPSPQSLTVLPLALQYSTSVSNDNIYIAEFDFSSINSSLTQLTQELVIIAVNSFTGNSQQKRNTFEVDPNSEFFQQQCNSWINSRDYVNDIYQSLEQAVNSSGSAYSVNTAIDGSTTIIGINTTALEALNISINVNELYSQVILEDDYIALVNLTESVNSSIIKLVEYIKFTTFINWQSGQELLHNSSRDLTGLTCYGLIDCLTSVSDVLQQLVANLPSEFRVTDNFDSFAEYTSSFVMLGYATNMTITAAHDLITPLYNLMNGNNVAMNYWCASPPNITQHPQSIVIATINSTIILSCNAISDVSVSYYWSKDGIPIDGIASNILTIQVDSMDDEGSYVCYAVNHISVTESAASNVDIQVPPMITQHPSDVEVYVGSDNGTMLSCRASGDPTPGYQWYFRHTDGSEYVLLMNETSSVLSIDTPQFTHAGSYYCNASNPQGHVTSNSARVTILGVTIPLFHVNISLDVECGASYGSGSSYTGSGGSNECRNISFINITAVVNNEFGKLFNTLNTVVPVLSNYSVISENQITLFLQVFSRNITSSEVIFQPFREIAENTIEAKIEIRNTIELLTNTVSNGTFQFSDGVYTLEPVNGSLVTSQLTELCPMGQYLHSSNIICINCPPGSQGITGSACTLCTTDTFQDQQGQVACKSCPSGQGTKSNGAVECTDICVPGSFSTTGLSPCTLCSAGTYQSSPRSTRCIDCPPSTTASNGSANCTGMQNVTKAIDLISTTITAVITTTVTPTIATDDDASDSSGSSSAGAIAASVTVAVVIIITIIITVVVLVVWYRRKMGKFHVDKTHEKAGLEVDNDLYGFSRQQDIGVDDDTKQPQGDYEYNTPDAQGAVAANNPVYDSEHQNVPANNPMYGDSGGDATYTNVNFDTRKVQMGTDSEYSYCKL